LLVTFAQNVVVAQSEEIKQFKAWLKWLEVSSGLTAVAHRQGLQTDTCAG